jgi:hypothetical protein
MRKNAANFYARLERRTIVLLHRRKCPTTLSQSWGRGQLEHGDGVIGFSRGALKIINNINGLDLIDYG